ncbi:MAG TPA: vitamin K epoxide reductase family protein [Microbacterium sp.]|nr:vitamin K epoxide reductase family protein [Microbacterium sp.]
MPEARPLTSARPTVLAVWLIIAGVVGWWAAFQLTVEKLAALADPDHSAACDFSLLVQCSANLDSWQGRVFGFPNPIIGLACWVAPIVVGFAILAGARFARWFWWLFELGMLFAFCFVCWLIYQSIFSLGTLCPWCMVTWVVTIPSFYAVTIHLLRTGILPAPVSIRRAAARLMAWVPLLAIISYAVIIVIAQLRLDALDNIFGTLFG